MSETLATALLKALKDRGADRVFGIPGEFVQPFFRAISETDILPLHTLSHEPSVGYAADAYTDLADFHYADLAQSLGGKGERVETCSELTEALKRAVEEEDDFYLIEAMLPRGSTSDALQRFTQAIRRISALASE